MPLPGPPDLVAAPKPGPSAPPIERRSSYEIRGGRGRQIWPPFGPGVTYGPNNRGISSLWGAGAAETAGPPNRGTRPVWWCVSVGPSVFGLRDLGGFPG